MEPHYDTEEWAAATTRGRRIFNFNYRMTGNELAGWELAKTVPMSTEPGLRETVYLWEKKVSEGRALLRINIAETDHWRHAQSQLHHQLLHTMRPAVPRGKGKLAKIGDVNFVGNADDEKAAASMIFTRGNLSVSVASVGEILVDVANVAKKLDQAFGEPPKKKDVEKGVVADRSPKPLKVKKSERVTLVERMPEPVARSGWLKIIVPDGEVAREGDALIYVSPKAGRKQIEEFVTH